MYITVFAGVAGRVTVFYCGNPTLARHIRIKCEQFGFTFRKEVF
jgi:hypothetical protein